jgi:hypothetical protein
MAELARVVGQLRNPGELLRCQRVADLGVVRVSPAGSKLGCSVRTFSTSARTACRGAARDWASGVRAKARPLPHQQDGAALPAHRHAP